MEKRKTNLTDFEKELLSRIDTFSKEYLTLGHLIKYNLYMLSESIVFSAIAQKRSQLFHGDWQTECAADTLKVLKWMSEENHKRAELFNLNKETQDTEVESKPELQ